MLTTLRECPDTGNIALSSEFCKHLQWFGRYAACSNGVSMMEDSRQPIQIYVDTCTTSCSALCQEDVYHVVFLQQVLEEGKPICELEDLNVAVVLKLWARTLAGRQVVLHSDSAMAVPIFQDGKGRQLHTGMC